MYKWFLIFVITSVALGNRFIDSVPLPTNRSATFNHSPSWSRWNYAPFLLKVNRKLIDKKVFVFGIICTAGTYCDSGMAEAPPMYVKLIAKDDNLLLLPIDSISPAPGLKPVARWQIEREDEEHLYVSPNPNEKLSVLHSMGQLSEEILTTVQDRFFHDIRSEQEGFWFHETVRYEFEFPVYLDSSPEKKRIQAIDTFSLYLIPDPFDPDFVPKVAIPEVGFFVNVGSWAKQALYTHEPPFNPSQLKAIHWGSDKEVEWVIDSKIPVELYPFFEQGILDWNSHLKTLRFKTRKADPNEELDSPYKNVVNYKIRPWFGGAYANFAFSLTTGEIFRAGVTFYGTERIPQSAPKRENPDPFRITRQTLLLKYNDATLLRVEDDFLLTLSTAELQQIQQYTRAVMSHEIGHTLGLRHNFKGNLYVSDVLNYPQGSSIMEYCTEMHKGKIGPYDDEAIQWAYEDKVPSARFAFCSDELANYDPDCNRFDVMTADVFGYYYPKLVRFLSEAVPLGQFTYDSIGFPDLLHVFRNFRNPLELFYNEDKFHKITEFFTIIAGYTEKMDPNVNSVQWMAARAINLLLLSVNVGLKYLDLKTFYQNREPYFRFIEWVSKTPGKNAWEYRKDIISQIFEWKNNPYGFAILKKMRERLAHFAEHSESETVRIENGLLLVLF